MKIRMKWTCSVYSKHKHRWRWMAWLCGRLQRLMQMQARQGAEAADAELNQAINEHFGWKYYMGEAMWIHGRPPPIRHEPLNYAGSLDAMAEAEQTLSDPKWSRGGSSNSNDHAPMVYLRELAKVCELKSREELVLSVSATDRGKLNFRPGPYPTPIELPPSAVVLGHSIPAYGYELCLVRATARQRAQAFVRTIAARAQREAKL